MTTLTVKNVSTVYSAKKSYEKKSHIAFPDLKNSTYIVKSDSIFLLGVPNANKKD